MKIDLSQLELNGFELELDRGRRVALTLAENVAGTLVFDRGGLKLEGASAERVSIASLALAFGAVELSVDQPNAELRSLRASAKRVGEGPVRLHLSCESLATQALAVKVGSVEVAFSAELRGVELEVNGARGRLAATSVEFHSFRLSVAGFQLVATTLDLGPIAIGWGNEFQLRAEALSAAVLDIALDRIVLRATQLTLAAVHTSGIDVDVRALSAARGELRFVRTEARADAGEQALSTNEASERAGGTRTDTQEDAAKPLLDWTLFDGLSGRVHVDVGVAYKLALFERRAVHEFRVPIEQGTLDFRELERGLAGLEDALLDFSVREDALVLELGLPFLPTRGLGRRLVAWDLSGDEQDLARTNRVRLARLARPRILVGNEKDETQPEPLLGGEERGETRLRELAFQNIDLELSVEHRPDAMDAALRRLGVDVLRVWGSLVHSVGREVSSSLGASAQRLHLDAQDLRLSDRRIDLEAVDIRRIPRVDICASGAHLQSGELELEGIRAGRIGFGRPALDD
jgi:hypothetical protein